MRIAWHVYITSIVLITIFTCTVLWFVKPIFGEIKQEMISPLPTFLSLPKANQVTTLDIWLPREKFQSNMSLLVSARAALSYDITTNQFLFAKNIHEKLPMASLTKIMTAIIALENKKDDDRYAVNSEALVGEDSMGLESNEVLSLKELLYGLILHSGNDAAEVLASNYFYGREKFVLAMNEKAKTLGLFETNFTNPTGLQGDGNQYTTAYDLLGVTQYALTTFPEFADIAQTISITLPQTTTHKEYYLENETNLLTSYPGVKGIKTGYTPEAGLCLVTYLDFQGHKIIAVLLGSENRRSDMKEMLDFSLRSLSVTPPPHS